MKIDGINPNAAIAMMKKSAHAAEEIPVESEETQNVEAPESENEAKGLLNLIQNGDFKSTPDIRHRINYIRQSTNQAFGDFKQTVEDQITGLKESGLLDDDQINGLDEFLEGLQGPKKEILGPDGSSLEGLIGSWNAILGGLVSQPETPTETEEPQDELLIEPITETDEEPVTTEPEVEEQQAPVEPSGEQPVEEGTEGTDPQADVQEVPLAGTDIEPPVDTGITTEEPETPPTNPLGELVTNFQNSLQQILDEYKSDLGIFSSLPPLPDSIEHGNAYAKFLNIYNTSIQPQPEAGPSEEESLDIEEPVATDETAIA